MIPGISTPFFSLENIDTTCRIVDIYDGDTITIVINMFSSYHKMNVRLAGIDTCELKGKNKELGLKAKARLFELLTKNTWCPTLQNKKNMRSFLDANPCVAKIVCGKFDKYGRLLGKIYVDENNQSVQDILVEEKLAYTYDGKAKLDIAEQLVTLA